MLHQLARPVVGHALHNRVGRELKEGESVRDADRVEVNFQLVVAPIIDAALVANEGGERRR